jgi:hypothetical protein
MLSNREYYHKIKNIFKDLKLDIWSISEDNLFTSKKVLRLANLFPEWFNILKKGFQNDRKEALRTLKHTIHTLFVYFSIMNKTFTKDVNKGNIIKLRRLLIKLHEYNPVFFPLILLYHDLSRPFNRTWHNIKSEELINQNQLLTKYNLSKSVKQLIRLVIKHHLLIGTIFTGESSYFGSISLYSDLIDNNKKISTAQIRILFDTLKAFTFIDIWGYNYANIYDHYFHYYNEICNNLSGAFQNYFSLRNENHQKKSLNKILFQLDYQNLKWRISGSLRIFQFVSTQSYLTENFYYSKIKQGLTKIGKNWVQFRRSLGQNHPRIQLKYALPLLMILSTNNFKRGPIKESIRVQEDIFNFWTLCANKVRKTISSLPHSKNNLFYFIFDLPQHWFFDLEFRKDIKKNILKKILFSSFSFNECISENIITIRIKNVLS